MFKSQIIVLFSKPYEVQDEKTGLFNRGVTIQYVMNENLLPKEDDDNAKGYKVNKGSLDFMKQGTLIQVPGLYDASFGLKTNGNGKPELVVEDIKFKGLLMIDIDESLALA